MTHEKTIRHLNELIPANNLKPRQPSGNRKIQYTWRLSSIQTIYDVCIYIEPYSVTKEQQIFLMLAICKYRLENNCRGKRITDSTQLMMCDLLSEMNRKGIQ